ncbi:hypothetical protein [Chitinivorax sp. B]|uniref:hypothetical protein n=1 Tax=Chitinivorax sp. B TaxID=2502235 RepID=UPI0010F71773|nr:hypothetical protein [Chitinivorax sp. B]
MHVVAFLLLCMTMVAHAEVLELVDSDLAEMTGQEGLSIKQLHYEFGGKSGGTGIDEVKANSLFFGFNEASGQPAFIVLEHLNGFIEWKGMPAFNNTPMLLDVVNNGIGSPGAVQLTLPGYVNIDLGIDSISTQSGLRVEREALTIVERLSGSPVRVEYEPKRDLGALRFTGQVQFNSGSWVKFFGH